MYRPFVQSSVILDWSESSVFLFDEEEGGGVWAFRWTYVALLDVFFDKFLKRFLLVLHEGVDLSWQGGWGIFLEFYCMIL